MDTTQVNAHALPLMVDYVLNRAWGEGDCTHLIDCYCGCGLFAVSAAQLFKSAMGVEVSDLAIQAARKNALQNGFENCEFRTGKSEAIFSNIRDHLPDQTGAVMARLCPFYIFIYI